MNGVVVFDITDFRTQFPAFADPVIWPDALLHSQFDMACCHISPKPGKRLAGASLTMALYLMTAHLLVLLSQGGGAGAGSDNGPAGGAALAPALAPALAMVASATVDKVSVSLTPPPLKSQWAWWLSLTSYGATLLALLKARAAGGLFVGGSPPERAGFRKAGGTFGTHKATS